MEKFKFKAGDKIKYIGSNEPGLYIKNGDVYTVKCQYTHRTIQLEEIKKHHDYFENDFIKANSQIIKQKLGVK